VNNFDRQAAGIPFAQEFAYAILLSYKDNGHAVLSSGLDRSVDLHRRPLVAAHRIDCDLENRHEDLFLSCLDDFPFFVVAAMRACTMRHAQFVAVRTLGKRARRQMIVRAAPIPPCL
jgi:hypothetical protein